MSFHWRFTRLDLVRIQTKVGSRKNETGFPSVFVTRSNRMFRRKRKSVSSYLRPEVYTLYTLGRCLPKLLLIESVYTLVWVSYYGHAKSKSMFEKEGMVIYKVITSVLRTLRHGMSSRKRKGPDMRGRVIWLVGSSSARTFSTTLLSTSEVK